MLYFYLTLIAILIVFVVFIKKLLKSTYFNMSAEQVFRKVSARIRFIQTLRILHLTFLLILILLLVVTPFDIDAIYYPFLFYSIFQLYLFRLFIQASNSSLVTILNEECDPYKFGQIQLGYRKYTKRETPMNTIKYNFAVALVNQGSYDDAFHVISDMTFKKFSPNLLLCQYSVLAICYFQTGDFESIHKLKSNLLLLRDDPRIKKSRKISMQKSCDMVLNKNIEYYLLEQIGNVEANYALNYALLSEAKSTLERVNLRLRLAKLDYRTGKIEGARVHCEYVIQNGNKLYAATKAKELLQTMNT